MPAFGVGSVFLGRVKIGPWGGDLSHAVSLECEAVGVVDDTIEDGVDVVPVLHRHPAGDDGRSALVAIVDDFEEIETLLAGERGEAPIIEDEQVHPRQHLDEPRIASVAAGERQSLEQPR